jgi:hypothetical protein
MAVANTLAYYDVTTITAGLVVPFELHLKSLKVFFFGKMTNSSVPFNWGVSIQTSS